MMVALRKESVDRNMLYDTSSLMQCQVALRKESVDRNSIRSASFRVCTTSLSARRAWIEILNVVILNALACCRSPQGERG